MGTEAVAAVTISVIIPTLNAARLPPKTLVVLGAIDERTFARGHIGQSLGQKFRSVAYAGRQR